MKKVLITLITVCAPLFAGAQTVNYVRNPSFEMYVQCPDDWNKIFYAVPWRNATDSAAELGMEFYHECGNTLSPEKSIHIPDNTAFWQYAHSGQGMAGAVMYNDKSKPLPAGLPYDYRDYLQGYLRVPLTAGKVYCVSFWINATEAAGYVHNKMGAYLDNGGINSLVDTAGKAITTVVPQVYTDDIIEDTMRWVKVEGSFTASGNETYITIGNFFPDAALSKKYPNYWHAFYTSSYYLIDDVSVVPLDWKPNAGPDTWVELGRQVSIGDTTAEGIDSKWYRKGLLIDSGGVISVNAAAATGILDTYVVVQTVCGMTKSDTVVVRTVPVGIQEYAVNKAFSIYPNPSNGSFTISANVILSGGQRSEGSVNAALYDLLGRKIDNQPLHFSNNQAIIHTKVPDGFYIFELTDDAGNVYRERVEIRN